MDTLNRPRESLAAACLCLLLAGCQTLGSSGLLASAVTADLTATDGSSIAGDLVTQLSSHLGPGSTTIRLRGDGSAFESALEASLRAAGYAIVTNQGAKVDAVDLAFAVDSFESSVMVRLSTEGLELTRLYRLEGGVAVPISPVSVLRRDEPAK
jgi:ferric-dicitrate binding protein FerR (iron transport regulator)